MGEKPYNRVFGDICRIRNVIYDLQTVVLDFFNDLSHFIDGGPETIRCIFEKQSDAGLLSKRRSGREQLATGDVQAVRSVASMLDELEGVWRGRVARIDELLHIQES